MCAQEEKNGFIENLLAAAEQSPDLTAIEMQDDEKILTYKDLVEQIEFWQGYLKVAGVNKGDMVLLLLPSSPEFIVSFYAIISAGGVAVPVAPDVTAYELEQLLIDAKPKGIITTHTLFTSMQQRFYAINTLQFILITDGIPDVIPQRGEVRIMGLTAMPRQKIPIAIPLDNPVVCCQYTYKGLGYPLGVLHRYADYTHGIECLIRSMTTNPGAVYLSVLPVYYVYSLTMMVLFPLSFGCKLVIIENISKQNFLELLERYQASICCVVPMLLSKLVLEAGEIKQERTLLLSPDLRIFSGGSLLECSLAQKVYEATGIETLQGYGLTETLPIILNYPNRQRRGAIGVQLSEKAPVYIMDEQGQQVPQGKTGEIVIGGFTVTEGFYNRPKETAQFLRDGLFYTGDLGFIDQDGFVFFVGRKYPISKVAAKMTDLTEIERVLLLHPDVLKVRVSVCENSLVGVQIIASVIMKRDLLADKKDLKRLCQERLSRHKIPSKFKIYTNISYQGLC